MLGIALLWGFGEATLFFLVPDVFLSFVALKSMRRALWGCLLALLGALLGGVLMYVWGSHQLDAVRAILDWVPAVSRDAIDGVLGSLKERGVTALFFGPLTGTPYKLYAAQAHAAGIGLPLFLLVSVPARLIRFVLVCCLVRWVAQRFLALQSLKEKQLLLFWSWLSFYIVFFSLKGL